MADTTPTLTIGLPIYNDARYLQGAVESILEQSFGDFELISPTTPARTGPKP